MVSMACKSCHLESSHAGSNATEDNIICQCIFKMGCIRSCYPALTWPIRRLSLPVSAARTANLSPPGPGPFVLINDSFHLSRSAQDLWRKTSWIRRLLGCAWVRFISSDLFLLWKYCLRNTIQCDRTPSKPITIFFSWRRKKWTRKESVIAGYRPPWLAYNLNLTSIVYMSYHIYVYFIERRVFRF